MKIVNKQEFENELSGNEVVLVDFYADWCGPCKMIGPVLEKLSHEYEGKASIIKVNVDRESDLASQFGVMSIPNLILFKNGQPVKQVVGFQAEPALKALIDSQL